MRISILALMLMSLVSCNNDEKLEQKATRPVFTVDALSIKIDSTKVLDEASDELVAALKEQEESDLWHLGNIHQITTDAMIHIHANHSSQKFEKIGRVDSDSHEELSQNYYSDMVSYLDQDIQDARTREPFWLKVSMEKFLKKTYGDVKYNKDHTHIINVPKSSRLQCYSGTYNLNLLLRKTYDLKTFHSQNLVVIYEPGHILNGFVRNGQLFGVESTTLGKSLVDYGKIKNVSGKIRIIDAEYFAIYETLKKYLSNSIEFGNQALEATAKKYKIDNIMLISEDTSLDYDEDTLLDYNYGVFAVPGKKDLPQGDITREKMEIVKRTDLPKDGNPNILRDGSQIKSITADINDYAKFFTIDIDQTNKKSGRKVIGDGPCLLEQPCETSTVGHYWSYPSLSGFAPGSADEFFNGPYAPELQEKYKTFEAYREAVLQHKEK